MGRLLCAYRVREEGLLGKKVSQVKGPVQQRAGMFLCGTRGSRTLMGIQLGAWEEQH